MSTSSSLGGDVATPTHSSRSRPSSSIASGDTKSPVTDLIDEKEVGSESLRPKVATVTLNDRSMYHGEINTDGLPNGVGVLLSVFGSRYAGAMKEGKKHGAGVELRTNGTSFSGEFENGVPCGLGIYVGTLGDKYIGQWEDGSRHGIGVCVDPDAEMATARFNMDEPVLTDNSDKDATTLNLSWEKDIQPHILRAIIAEKAAIRYQEDARQRHTDAAVQEMTAIGPEKLNTPESIEAFEAKKELELEEFLQDQSIKLQEVNAVAGELKVAEAQLIQRQKEVRTQITTRRQELTQMAKYVAMAETRAAQVREAERTLSTLQRQLEMLVPATPVAISSRASETDHRRISQFTANQDTE